MKQSFRVPAKAMLLGEYGVVHGGPALGMTIPAVNFQIDIETVQTKDTQPQVGVESAFLTNGSLYFSLPQGGITLQSVSPDEKFFSGLLLPYADILKNQQLKIQILKSFSPSLGFGSSSAILTAVHTYLWQLKTGERPSFAGPAGGLFWNNVMASLKAVQGKGSGYDVAMQCMGLWSDPYTFESKPTVWTFVAPTEAQRAPAVQALNSIKSIKSFGVFVESGIYSNTAHAMKRFTEASEAKALALEHTTLCQQFLTSPTIETLKAVMSQSLALARGQGIVVGDDPNLKKFVQTLDILGAPYKTMGGGLGDCFWVLTTREELRKTGVIHPLLNKPMHEAVVFDFESEFA